MKLQLLTTTILIMVISCSPVIEKTPPTSTATASLASTRTQMPAATTIPTSTPTTTLIPTKTSTPYPTATSTPQGYQISELGFSILLPANWQADDSYEGFYAIDDTGLSIYIGGGAITPDDNVDLETIIKGMCDNDSTSEQEDVTLADGTIATQVFISCIGAGEDVLQYLLFFAQAHGNVYLAFALHPNGQMSETDLQAFKSIITTIRFIDVETYGLPYDETLILEGVGPFEEDLDPAVQFNSADEYVGLLYSGLVRLTPDLQVVPDLAESWIASQDGLVYTFTLRSGLTFSSGSPLTSNDVRYSWERAADPATGSSVASTFLGDILGVTEKLAGNADEIIGIKVIDDQTLQVTLGEPVSYFLTKLTYPTSFVVPRQTIEADPDEWMFHPDSSGPYTLKEHKLYSRLIFERNDLYYEPAKIRYVVYKLRETFDPEYDESMDVDIFQLYDTQAEEIKSPDNRWNSQLLGLQSFCTTYILFNNSKPPMNDLNVREALSLSIDKDRVLTEVYNGLDPLADTFLPPAMLNISDFTLQTYDPEAARTALAASQYADAMPVLTLSKSAVGGGIIGQYEDLLMEMWQENLGIEVEIEFLPVNYVEAAHENHGDMIEYNWCADIPDPSNFLETLFYSDNYYNVSGYSNPQLDALLEQARIEQDPAQRLNLYIQVESMLREDYAGIPIHGSMSYLLISPRVQGFTMTPLGVRIIPYIWLAEP